MMKNMVMSKVASFMENMPSVGLISIKKAFRAISSYMVKNCGAGKPKLKLPYCSIQHKN
jgi:hypothetical protein